MNATIKSLGIDSLSIDQKIRLVEDIWDNIAKHHAESIELTDEQKTELDRRIADYESNPSNVISWEEVKASTIANFRR